MRNPSLRPGQSSHYGFFKSVIAINFCLRFFTSKGCIIILLFFASCNRNFSREEFAEWIRKYENAAHVSITTDEFVFDVQYEPAEYLLIKRNIHPASSLALAEELNDLSGIQYYVLTISTQDKSDFMNYGIQALEEKQRKQYYFSYNFQDDITLEEDGKMLPCVLYHFERPAGADGGRKFVLGFENLSKDAREAKLMIHSELFGSLPIKIKVSKANIPKVDL